MNDICFSSNGEEFKFDDFDDAIEDVLDINALSRHCKYDPAIPQDHVTIVCVYQGETFYPKASNFILADLDIAAEKALEHCSEYAEGWLSDLTSDAEQELQNLIAPIVDLWAIKHRQTPNFGFVRNISEQYYAIWGEHRMDAFLLENYTAVKARLLSGTPIPEGFEDTPTTKAVRAELKQKEWLKAMILEALPKVTFSLKDFIDPEDSSVRWFTNDEALELIAADPAFAYYTDYDLWEVLRSMIEGGQTE